MRYLIPAILCFVVAVLALSQISCGPTWKEVTPPIGEYKLYATITVQQDWCMMDGEKVNGVIEYNTVVRSVSKICVSLKSDDPERTLQHELSHAWRNAVGLDATARNQ
jgi:hypothetical protein